eukprot:TRINITY_DN16327_c0_g2_i3.p1 TRINITY_DN16327_c0_g2~~TRINITY_DN16327_c0_g2_i3.p1  ORF type:complete len:254 (-),score=19.34 TRINITY_DN16327_c0_g2_i3:15-776(-)
MCIRDRYMGSHSCHHKKRSNRNRSRNREGERARSRAYSLPRDNTKHISEYSSLSFPRKHRTTYFSGLVSALSRREAVLKAPVLAASGGSGASRAQQATHVANLIFILRTTNWTRCDRRCYLVTTEWFDRWSEYVDFSKHFNMKKVQLGSVYTQAQESAEAIVSDEYPGEIGNQCLLANEKEFYHNYGHPKALCNFVLREPLEENRDYYIVTKDIWDYLRSIYRGFELPRDLSLIHICRCRRYAVCRSRWSPYH